eukprot:gnl/Hemi2/12646_TR4323_c0_g1_i1.p1 gnl/Hemi2/12646_TR4323_c0_g1~~gnl/Hemi2/12646_TR4323_c0_g1_i1.p1  ORF type:complete len:698 (+),score=285.45 gnl/Hemi2/12646_TR4323_c0_g1_i1:96-2189(+)
MAFSTADSTRLIKKRREISDPEKMEVDKSRMEWTMSHKKRETFATGPRRARSISPDRRSLSPDLFARTDVTSNPLANDLAKGTICIKKKKLPGVSRIAAAGNEVWCVTEQGLRVMSQNARDLRNFDDYAYQSVLGVQHRVFAGTKTGTICVFDTQTIDYVYRLDGHTGSVNVLCAGPDGVWSAGTDGTIRLWEIEVGTHRKVLHGPSDLGEINALACYGSEVWAGSENGNIYIFDPSVSDTPREVLAAHEKGVYALCTYGNQVWSGSEDRHIHVWDGDTKALSKQLIKHNGRINCLTVVGGKIWSGSHDSKVGIWHPKRSELVGVLPGVYTQITDIAVVGLFVWVATRDEMLRVFVSQGLVEHAQALLNKYSVQSIADLESLFTQTMAENEQLCLLLRSLKTQLLRSDAWYSRNAVPDHVDKRSERQELEMEELVERLKDLETRWGRQHEHILTNWDLPTMIRELASELRRNDQVKKDLSELRGLFAEVDKNLVAEVDRMTAELKVQKEALDKKQTELAALQTKYSSQKNDADTRLEDLTARALEQNQKIDALTTQLEANQKELETLKKNKVQIDESYKQVQTKYTAASEQNKTQTELKQKLEREVGDKERERKRLEDALAQAKAEATKSSADLSKARADVKELQENLESLGKRLAAVDSELKEQQNLQTKAKAENDALAQKNAQLEKKIKEKCLVV